MRLFLLIIGVLSAGPSLRAEVVRYFAGRAEEKPRVLVDLHKFKNAEVGTVFHLYRHSPAPGLPRETGRVKLVRREAGYGMAEVLQEKKGADLGAFPMVMAGDFLVRSVPKVHRQQKLLPRVAFSYFDIFVDPHASPGSFELTPQGKILIEQSMKKLHDYRFSNVFVKAFTDHEGSVTANQIESFSRAIVVKEFLSSLGIPAEKIIPFGFGESEIHNKSLVSGYKSDNRKIVISIPSS